MEDLNSRTRSATGQARHSHTSATAAVVPSPSAMTEADDKGNPRLSLAWIRAVEQAMRSKRIKNKAELARISGVESYEITRILDVRNVGRKTSVITRVSEALEIPLPADQELDNELLQPLLDLREEDPDLYANIKLALVAMVKRLREFRAARASLAELFDLPANKSR